MAFDEDELGLDPEDDLVDVVDVVDEDDVCAECGELWDDCKCDEEED